MLVWRRSLRDRTSPASLPADELARAARISRRGPRDLHLLRRTLLRDAVSRSTGIPVDTLALTRTPAGEPRLAGDPELRLSASSAGALALVALRRTLAVGVDVERIRAGWGREIARRMFAPAEAAALDGLTGEERDRAFFAAWVRKEAWAKASGLGMDAALRGCEVTVLPEEPPRIVRLGGSARAARGWVLREVPVQDGYVACVAGRGAWRLEVVE